MSANLMSLARSGGKFLKLFGDRKMVKQLPYDAEVEYLESTGTQWIDTGVVPNSDYGFEVELMKIDISETVPLGTWKSWLKEMFGGDFKYTQKHFLGTFGSNNIEINYEKINNIIIEKLHHKRLTLECNGLLDYDNVFTESFACNFSIFLFGCNYSGVIRFNGICRMFRAQITDENDTLVRDFIPVLDREMRPAMYDRVTGKLFYNKGSGEFLIGPDKTI